VIDAAGHLDARAAQIVQTAASWTEISPSGGGLHIFVQGTVPAAVKGEQIEIYSDARYICVTGHPWPGTPDAVQDGQRYLDHLVGIARRLDPSLAAPRRPWTGTPPPPPDDLAGALIARLDEWSLPATRIKRWSDGYLIELESCPWAAEHTSGPAGAAVMIHASGAYDFTCLHAHCSGRGWREFRAAVEGRR